MKPFSVYGYRNRKRKTPLAEQKNALVPVNVHIPKTTFEFLTNLSNEKEIPISKLINYALDNELDCSNPFEFDMTVPDVPYIEFQYAEQAAKILRYLVQWFPGGTGLDMLLLCRKDLAIESRDELLLGYRELKVKDMIEEFYPANSRFKYARTYRYVRPSIEVIETHKRRKYKEIIKLNSVIEKGPLDESES